MNTIIIKKIIGWTDQNLLLNQANKVPCLKVII